MFVTDEAYFSDAEALGCGEDLGDIVVFDEAVGPEMDFRLRLHAGDVDEPGLDRKSTRLNSSHVVPSYALFRLR